MPGWCLRLPCVAKPAACITNAAPLTRCCSAPLPRCTLLPRGCCRPCCSGPGPAGERSPFPGLPAEVASWVGCWCGVGSRQRGMWLGVWCGQSAAKRPELELHALDSTRRPGGRQDEVSLRCSPSWGGVRAGPQSAPRSHPGSEAPAAPGCCRSCLPSRPAPAPPGRHQPGALHHAARGRGHGRQFECVRARAAARPLPQHPASSPRTCCSHAAVSSCASSGCAGTGDDTL